MAKSEFHPEAMLCFDIYRLHQAFGQLYKQLLARLGLTYPQYLVMVLLWGEDGQTLGAIGRQLGLGTGTLTPLVKRLEKAGLLRRSRDTEDERRVHLYLTERGRALRQEAEKIPDLVTAATGLRAAEIGPFRERLSALRAAIGRSASATSP